MIKAMEEKNPQSDWDRIRTFHGIPRQANEEVRSQFDLEPQLRHAFEQRIEGIRKSENTTEYWDKVNAYKRFLIQYNLVKLEDAPQFPSSFVEFKKQEKVRIAEAKAVQEKIRAALFSHESDEGHDFGWLSQRLEQHRAQHANPNQPKTYTIVTVQTIKNNSGEPIQLDVLYEDADPDKIESRSYISDVMSEGQVFSGVNLLLVQKGQYGYPTLIISSLKNGEVVKYRPSGTTEFLTLEIIRDAEGKLTLIKRLPAA